MTPKNQKPLTQEIIESLEALPESSKRCESDRGIESDDKKDELDFSKIDELMDQVSPPRYWIINGVIYDTKNETIDIDLEALL